MEGGRNGGRDVGRDREREGDLGCGEFGALYTVVRMELDVLLRQIMYIIGDKYKWDSTQSSNSTSGDSSRIQILRRGLLSRVHSSSLDVETSQVPSYG